MGFATHSLKICVSACVFLMFTSEAWACQFMKPYNEKNASLVFEGTALDIDLIYDKPFNLLKPLEKRSVMSSVATFKIDKIIRGEYESDTIKARFPFDWFGGPPIKLGELTQGYKKKATVGVRAPLDGTKNAEDVPMNVVGGLCSDCLLYTSPSPRDATLSRMPSSA